MGCKKTCVGKRQPTRDCWLIQRQTAYGEHQNIEQIAENISYFLSERISFAKMLQECS